MATYIPAQVDHSRAIEVARLLDLDPARAEDLMGASGIPVYVVGDDSFSMTADASTPHGTRQSRWKELLSNLQRLHRVLAFPNPSGAFQLMMLNSKGPGGATLVPMVTEHDVAQIATWAQPSGGTPLKACLSFLFNEVIGRNNRAIVVVLTDGEPNDCSFSELRDLVQRRDHAIAVNFVMCTDEDRVVDQYNRHMDPIPFVDVHDDFHSEQLEAERMGRDLPLNLYLVKCLLGALLPKYDKMDEIATPVAQPIPEVCPVQPPPARQFVTEPRPGLPEPHRTTAPRREKAKGCCVIC